MPHSFDQYKEKKVNESCVRASYLENKSHNLSNFKGVKWAFSPPLNQYSVPIFYPSSEEYNYLNLSSLIKSLKFLEPYFLGRP